MNEVRKLDLIIEKLRDLDSIIRNSQSFLLENPDDEIINFVLEQDLFRKNILLNEFK